MHAQMDDTEASLHQRTRNALTALKQAEWHALYKYRRIVGAFEESVQKARVRVSSHHLTPITRTWLNDADPKAMADLEVEGKDGEDDPTDEIDEDGEQLLESYNARIRAAINQREQARKGHTAFAEIIDELESLSIYHEPNPTKIHVYIPPEKRTEELLRLLRESGLNVTDEKREAGFEFESQYIRVSWRRIW